MIIDFDNAFYSKPYHYNSINVKILKIVLGGIVLYSFRVTMIKLWQKTIVTWINTKMPESRTKVLECFSNKTQDFKILYSQKNIKYSGLKIFDSKCIEE